MTTMTIAPTGGDQHKDPDYYRGRADAYDEHKAGADLDTLEDRVEWMTDPTTAHTVQQLIPTAYIQGYLAHIHDERAGQHWDRYLANSEYAAWLEATR